MKLVQPKQGTTMETIYRQTAIPAPFLNSDLGHVFIPLSLAQEKGHGYAMLG